ncbi:hypothetical protein IMSAGC006_02260 [Muribaculaceae bacterium]|nr:hypothetical protein IMSAGC006_02260 [Muribaculaceae bacterium]
MPVGGRRGDCAVGQFLLGGGVVVGTCVVFIHLEAVHTVDRAALVVVILRRKLLILLQQVGYMVGAKHEHSTLGGYLGLVECLFERDDVAARQSLAVAVHLACGEQHRGLGRMLRRSKGVDCAAEPHFVECLFVAFYDGSHLVVAERVEFVVGDAGGLALVFVEAHGDVAVGERLHLQRVGRVVHKHFGVYSDIDHVDRVLFYILVVAADFVVPSDCGGSGAERFHKFACPHFGIKPGAERVGGCETAHERRAYRNAVERQCSGERRDTHGHTEGRAHCGGQRHSDNHAHKGEKKSFHSSFVV